MTIDPRYLELLRVHRPAYGEGERAMRRHISRFITANNHAARLDAHGNVSCTVGASRTMFTAHMDTAIGRDGNVEIQHTKTGFIKAIGSILGADDASGIYIMLKMIQAGVPGHYFFFCAEEVGGIGSSNLAKDPTFDYELYDRAIAFDRAGTKDVITHQGDRCCSQEFALELSSRLGMGYRPDDSGIFTDTANLMYLIPECTNISVGYNYEHTKNEIQDWRHLEALTARCLEIDWESLPTRRDPDEDDAAGFALEGTPKRVPDLEEVVMASPELVAMLLDDMGYDKFELINALYEFHLALEKDS